MGLVLRSFSDNLMAAQQAVILSAMSVQIQPTPNPNARKFVLPRRVFAQPVSFASAEAAATHALAAQLFALGTIYNVFMVQDFITVNKLPGAAWDGLEEQIRTIIANFFDL